MVNDETIDFLNLVYPSAEAQVALCLIPSDDLPVEHRFTKVSDVPKFLPFCRAMNARNWNVYITPSVMKPSARNRRKESFLLEQSIIYLDCDDQTCLNEIKARYPYPTLVIKTSRGRYQVYWKLIEPITVRDQENLMRMMARNVGADIATTDVSRVMRLAGFWNRKPNRNCTVDIVFKRNYAVEYKFLSQSANSLSLANQPNSAESSTHGESRRVLGSLVDGGSVSTGRQTESERDWYFVNWWLSLGVDRDECIKRIEERRVGQKRNLQNYAMRTVDKAIRLRGGVK